MAKRTFDLLVLCLLAPLACLVAALVSIAVCIDSPGPVLYRAKRIGRGGGQFTMLKFRTMRTDVAGSLIVGGGADARITPVGAFLRRTRLDELPQLWNVLRGQMSLVGPRPELKEFVDLHPDQYREILSVPPGITGPTQLRYAGIETETLGGQDDPDAYYRERLLPDKVALDLAYARSSSLADDLRVIGRTTMLPLVLASNRPRETAPTTRLGDPALALLATLLALGLLIVLFGLGLGPSR